MSFCNVDGSTFDEGELATGEGGTYGPGDGGQHGEILARSVVASEPKAKH